MGWTSTDAHFYTESGKVDRKAECDNLYTWENEKTKTDVLKSAMKGAIYYAAVRTTDKASGNSEVWAAVCITSTKRDGWFNFGYKSMSENCGPFYCDCPKSILVLLTDTNSEYAKEWREKCWANIRTPKKSLASVKIGEIIEFEYGGETIRAEKMAPAYQFKTPWFKRVGKDVYIKKNHIKDWVVVQAEAKQPATAAETPQISTESVDAANVSAESTTEPETAKYRICRYSKNGYAKIAVGDRKQGKVVAILLTINGRSYIEINDEAARISTMGQKPLQIAKPITALTDAEVLELIYTPTRPPEPFEKLEQLPQPPKFAPQSRETLPTANYATPTRKRRQRANKRPNSAFRKFRTTRPTILRASAKCSPANPPPIGRPQLTPHW